MDKLKISLGVFALFVLVVIIAFSMRIKSFHCSSFIFTVKNADTVVIENLNKEGYTGSKWEIPREDLTTYGVKQRGNSHYFYFSNGVYYREFKISETDFKRYKEKNM